MAAQTRIYCVSDGKKERLVRAHHPSAAIKHVADGTIKAWVATQEDLVTMMGTGAVVEEAGKRQQPEEAGDPPGHWEQQGREMLGETGEHAA